MLRGVVQQRFITLRDDDDNTLLVIQLMKNAESNSQLSIFHLFFFVALFTTPYIGFVSGGRQFGWIGSVVGLIIGVPIGALFGYAPHWVVGKILKYTESRSSGDTQPK
ncbi:MAG: hypothetical protein AAGA30_10300 [Planctomycetota bacterium]